LTTVLKPLEPPAGPSARLGSAREETRNRRAAASSERRIVETRLPEGSVITKNGGRAARARARVQYYNNKRADAD